MRSPGSHKRKPILGLLDKLKCRLRISSSSLCCQLVLSNDGITLGDKAYHGDGCLATGVWDSGTRTTPCYKVLIL